MYIENGFLLLVYLIAMLSVFVIGFLVTALGIYVVKGKEEFKEFWKREF